MADTRLTKRRVRLLGILPLAFFTAQAIHYWQINELGHTLWMCNIGNLLLAIGLFFEQAILIRIAVIWMVPGVVVWFLYVVPTWGMLLTGSFSYAGFFGAVSSTLAHMGGFSVGLIVLRKVRVDRNAWFYAFLWYFVVQLVSRAVTPAALNVNLSHNVQTGWEGAFSSYWKFWAVLSFLVGLGLWILVLLLRTLWPTSPASAEDATSP
ncbi:MAG TPA: hypothetical protein VMZ30_10725 [Pyrinomonadaceae bacterium]|nr:hypothetical protein [Pyrinomonadaceae bacterium]